MLVQRIHTTIEGVPNKEWMSYGSVLGVPERRIAPSVNWFSFRQIETLGLDEDYIPRKGKAITS